MADVTKRVDYFYVEVHDQPDEAFRIMSALKEHRCDLISCTAFPLKWNRAQISFVPMDAEAFRQAAAAARFKISEKKQALMIQGDDRPGAAAETLKKLADAKINVTAYNATRIGEQFAMILWVKQKDYEHAAKTLGA
jgi:hypothetical protein